jgi:hypothetical protein
MFTDLEFEFRIFVFADARAYVTHWLYRNTRSAIKAAKMMACDERFEIWQAGQCIYRYPGNGARHSS